LPELALKPFGPNIWIADGATVAVVGFLYPTRVAIIKLPGGGLFAWSPIALTGDLRAQVDALGAVRFIVAPNSLHHLFLPEWQRAYPDAKLYAAPGLRPRRKDIAFDDDLGDAPAAPWAGHIDQVPMRGNLITTEIVFFHRDSGAVLFTDLIQNFPPRLVQRLARHRRAARRPHRARAGSAAKIPRRLHRPRHRPCSPDTHPCLADRKSADGARHTGL